MKWRFPVRWDMAGVMLADGDTIEDAYENAKAQASEVKNLQDVLEAGSEWMLEGSFEIDIFEGPSTIRVLREEYNYGRPDIDTEKYPELKEYDEEYRRELCWCNSESNCSCMSIMFEAGEAVFSCDVKVDPVHCGDTKHAIGVFLSYHPNICYSMIREVEWTTQSKP